MNKLMRALTVILILQVAVLCYSLYRITIDITTTGMSTIDCASLVDEQGEE